MAPTHTSNNHHQCLPLSSPSHLSALLRHCTISTAKSIHAHILKHPTLSLSTFLFNRLIQFYSLSNHPTSALQTLSSIPNPNSFSFNLTLSALSKRSSTLPQALHLFSQIPNPDSVSFSTLISALSRNSLHHQSLAFFHSMLSRGLLPTHFTFAGALAACSDLQHGRSFHALGFKLGLLTAAADPLTANSFITLYIKCGCTDDALWLFAEMGSPNAVSVTAVMGGLVSAGEALSALKLFVEMYDRGVDVDEVAASCVLGACARNNFDGVFVQGMLHGLVVKKGFDGDFHVGNSMIDMYAKCGKMVDAEKVFEGIGESVSVVSWNTLIAGYGRSEDGEKGLEMIESMRRSGFEPDDVTYIGLLGGCNECGDVLTARKVFEKIVNPSVASWNALISGYCQEGRYEAAVELFRKMQFRCVQPDRTTLAIVLSLCSGSGHLGFGKEVHGAAIGLLLHDDMYVASGLVDMYSKCGRIGSAQQVFDRMPVRDVVCWNSMIAGFAIHSLNNEAFSLFRLMRAEGVTPTQFSYASMINSCASFSSLSQGRQIHAEITKNGYDADVYVGSALIDTYFKCGNVDEAEQFFEHMPIKNIVSWNEMINGYAQNGLGERAIGVFEQMMRAKEKPDGVTFISVLNACSHCGLVDKGIEFLESMERDYGIEPLANHYTCVIDSLGRAGRLIEAEKLVDRMKWKGDPIVWEVLLGSCALHGDARLGRRAAEELFRLDPNNSASYVLLSNIYAGLGRWEDASEVRTLMSNHGVLKNRGYSWLNMKAGVRAFMVDDGEGRLPT